MENELSENIMYWNFSSNSYVLVKSLGYYGYEIRTHWTPW